MVREAQTLVPQNVNMLICEAEIKNLKT